MANQTGSPVGETKPRRNVAIGIFIDWQKAEATFSEESENGIAIVNGPSVSVPLMIVMRIASEAIHRSLPPVVQQMDFSPVEQQQPDTSRDGTLAFDANVRARTH
jgi:hypothetical protein